MLFFGYLEENMEEEKLTPRANLILPFYGVLE
jgi:hypothetical protein